MCFLFEIDFFFILLDVMLGLVHIKDGSLLSLFHVSFLGSYVYLKMCILFAWDSDYFNKVDSFLRIGSFGIF